MNTLAELQTMVGKLVVLQKPQSDEAHVRADEFVTMKLTNPAKETRTLGETFQFDNGTRSYNDCPLGVSVAHGDPFMLLRAEKQLSVFLYGLHPEFGFIILSCHALSVWEVAEAL